MNSRWLALLLALVLSLSGCLGFLGGDDPETDPDGDPDDDADDGNDPDPDGPGDEQDGPLASPEASLSADLSTGQVPLNVTFTLDASYEGEDDLGWSLDLGDGGDLAEGDELPATVDHSYTEAGNYTVVLTVKAGELEDTASLNLTVSEVPLPDPESFRFFFRGDGTLESEDPLPADLGINGSLSLEPGSTARAVQTTGPLQSVLSEELGELVVFTSGALDRSFTLESGVETIQDRDDADWTVAEHASVHFCTRGNGNGVFNASVYEVAADGTRTLVLQNAGKQFAGTGPTESCEDRRLSFVEDVDTHTFAAGSSIQITLSPDVFLGSVATQLLFNGASEPHDSSLDLSGYFL